ncbi:MAG TPA: CAP domain-containing protein, partial [Massilia sp.]|nr:CAP domain-containing protein [Massilia sp.]
AQAAREHSSDMAAHRRFSHRGSDDSEVAQRATRVGYRWRHIGENIAAGQTSAQEAVAGWLESPGHCANLMNPDFSEMGAGYAISRARMPGFAYWTQVFAMP